MQDAGPMPGLLRGSACSAVLKDLLAFPEVIKYQLGVFFKADKLEVGHIQGTLPLFLMVPFEIGAGTSW